MGSSQTRARTHVPCIGRQILNHCATGEALFCHFYLVLPHPLPSSVAVLNKAAHIPSTEPRSLVLEEEKQSLSSKNCVCCNLSRGYLRNDISTCFCIAQNLLRLENSYAESFFQNNVCKCTICCQMGQKSTGEENNRCTKSLGRKDEEFPWEIRGFKKATYMPKAGCMPRKDGPKTFPSGWSLNLVHAGSED